MKKLFLALATVFCMSVLSMNVAQAAWNPFSAACSQGSGQDSAVCSDGGNTTDPISGNDGVIMNIINLISVLAGVAAVVIIIIGGIMYIQSEGNSDKTTAARQTIIYALAGLVVIAFARVILGFVLYMIQKA